MLEESFIYNSTVKCSEITQIGGCVWSSDEDGAGAELDLDLPDEKIGAKKLKKLQDKAEKRAQREVMVYSV